MSSPKVDNAQPLFTPREINTAYCVHFTAAIAVVTMLALAVFGHLTGVSGGRIMGATLIGGTALSVGSMLFIARRQQKAINDETQLKANKLRQQLFVALFLGFVVFGILGITGTIAASDVAKGSLVGSSLISVIGYGCDARDKIAYLITAMMVAFVVLNALASTHVITGDSARYCLAFSNMIVSSAIIAKTFHKMSKRPAGPNDSLLKKTLGLYWIADMVMGILGAQGTLQTPALLANTLFIGDQVQGIATRFIFVAKPMLKSYNNIPQKAST